MREWSQRGCKNAWYRMRAAREPDDAAEIMIFDEIGASMFGEGVTAKQFVADLKDLGPVKDILLRINSPGGDVFDALAIFNALKAHTAQISVRIEGIAASAASLIAMAGDLIEMPSNSFMLVHQARMIACGTADEFRAAADDLGRMNESFAGVYAARTKSDLGDVKKLMAEDRLMSASEAKKLGYADEITDEVKMAASWGSQSLKMLPENARAEVEAVFIKDTEMTKIVAEQDEDTKKEMDAMRARIEALEAKGCDDPDKKAEASSDGGDTDDDKEKDEPEAKVIAFKQGHKQAMAYAQEITDLCSIAGLPDKSAEFIRDGMPVAEVRKELMSARRSGAGGVDGRHEYAGGQNKAAAEEIQKGWDKALAKVETTNARASRGRR